MLFYRTWFPLPNTCNYLPSDHTDLQVLIVKTPALIIIRLSFNRLEINPLNAQLNPICHLLALLGTHHILHISRIKVK
jgi:hypothetical protein